MEDISIEIMMILTVTFLLYWMNPLTRDDKFQTIPTFENCIVQVAIQLAFELLSDVFALYWSGTKHSIRFDRSEMQMESSWHMVWIVFLLWQSLEIAYWHLG